jgi:hypothetical protein
MNVLEYANEHREEKLRKYEQNTQDLWASLKDKMYE